MKIDANKSTPSVKSPLVRRASGLMALEQRFMFDGAAVADLAATVAAEPVESAPVAEHVAAAQFDVLAPVSSASSDTLNAAKARAQSLITDFLKTPDAQAELFKIFNGQAQQPSAEWTAAFEQLLASSNAGTDQIRLELRSSELLHGAMAAFSATGTTGQATIYVNRDWIEAGVSVESVTAVLMEEMGHSLDARLNPTVDTDGDEGERFSYRLMQGTDAPEGLGSDDDHAVLRLDGQDVAVEMASFSFPSPGTLSPVGAYEVDTTRTPAEKEGNIHEFLKSPANPIVGVTINDAQSAREFSGNDVSVTATFTYANASVEVLHGWVSRPIKVGGVVKGFYFWTDVNFTSLSAAQSDGNADADRDVTDNRGFVLVWDKAYFGALTNTGGYSRIGSSSDRVDSALNSLMPTVNTTPVATNDTADGANGSTAAEESGVVRSGGNNTAVATVNAAGNVLSNAADTDADGDPLIVTKIGISSSAQSAVALGTTDTTGSRIVGTYGTLTMGANGAYSYVVNNQNTAVNALQVGSTLNDVFTYTISDGKGGTATATLTVVVRGTDDAPVANPDYNTAKESTTLAVSGIASTGYTAVGTVIAKTDLLANDTDVDTADTKTITGIDINGTFTAGTVTNSSGVSNLDFSTSENSFNTNTINGKRLFVSDGTTFRQVYSSTGTVVTAGVATQAGSDWTVPLNASPSYYLNGSSQQVAITNWNGRSVVFSDATTATTTGSGSDKSATSKASVTVGATVNVPGAVTGTLAVGMTLSSSSPGTFTAGTQISALTYTNGLITQISFDKPVSFSSGAVLTLTGSTTAGVALKGAHGSLVLDADGSYTYTPTTDNNYLASGQSAVEVFDYTMKDSQNVTSSSKLYITVLGVSNTNPALVDDQGTAYESGVGRSSVNNSLLNDSTAYSGLSATGNTLTNDPSLSGRAVDSYTRAGGTTVATAGNALAGAYGSLTMSAAGVYTYTVTDGNSAVDALLPTQTLTESFLYKVTTSSAGSGWAKLTITIQGTNDRPTAVVDTGSVTEDSLPSTSGNVLANDTDVEYTSGDTKVVSRVGASTNLTVNVTGANAGTGQSVLGTYGDLVIGANGTYVYTLRNSDANVQALAYNATANDVFTYEVKDTNSAVHTATLTITVNGSNEPPVNTFPTSVIATMNTAYAFGSAISVNDADANLTSVTLHVDNGVLTSTYTNAGLTVANTGADVVLTGNQTLINNYLAALSYTPTANFTGTDFLTIYSKDSAGGADSDGFAINIPTVTTATVSEPALTTGSNSSLTGELYSDSLTLALGQTVVSVQTGSIRDGSNNVIGSWTVNVNGTFSVQLTTASAATSSSFTYVAYDSYGNAVTNRVDVAITDDLPTISTTAGVANSLQVDETNFAVDATTTLASLFTPVNGADGRQSLVYGLSVSSAGVDSGTVDMATGQKVYLYLESGVVMGRVGTAGSASASGTEAFRLTINTGTAAVTLNQSRALQHPTGGASSPDETISLASGVLSLSATLTDGDGDVATQSIDLGGASGIASFKDDAPSAVGESTTATEGGSAITGTLTSNDSFGADGAPTNKVVAATQSTATITVGTPFTTAANGTLTINADGTYSYTPPPNGNVSTSGVTESFTYTIADRDGDTTTATFAIQVADGSVSQYSVNDVTVNEAAGNITFTITRSGDTSSAGAVSYSTADHTASASADYTSATATSVSFAANQTTASVVVAIADDSVFELSEDFYINLSGATNGGLLLDDQGVGTIKDDGAGGDDDGNNADNASDTAKDDDRPSFAINDVVVNEAAGTMTFTVTKTGATALSSTVAYAMADGTAAAGTDFTTASGTLTFAAGDTTKTVTVAILNDSPAVFEGSETFNVNLSGATNATISDAQGVGTIKDDGAGGDDDGNNADNASDTAKDDDRPSFAINDVVVNEAAGTMTFTVTKTGATALSSTVAYAMADGTAAAGTDFTTASGTLTFAAGDTTKTVTVAILNDSPAVFEGSETFNVNLSGATNATISDAQGVGTIKDDGAGGDDDGNNADNASDTAKDDDRPSFSVSDVTVGEGNLATFTVTRNGASLVSQSVDVATLGLALLDTAESDDFTPLAPRTLTFAAGVSTQTVAVQTTQDAHYEGAETFRVQLANATGAARISTTFGTATGTIVDDGRTVDGVPTIDDRSVAVNDSLTVQVGGQVTRDIILSNDGPTPSVLSITSISYDDLFGDNVTVDFADLALTTRSGYEREVELANGTLFIKASGETLYEHAGRRFMVTATSADGLLEYKASATDTDWTVLAVDDFIIVTLADIEQGLLRYTPLAGGADINRAETTAAEVTELDWTTDGFTYTVTDGAEGRSSAVVTYTTTGEATDDFEAPVAAPLDADVDEISTKVESVLANRALGLTGVEAKPYVLDLANLTGTSATGTAVLNIGTAYDGDLNQDKPTSVGDGYQNGVTTFAWINSVEFNAANANPLTSSIKPIVTMVAEDTGSSKGVPNAAIQLRGVYVEPLTTVQKTALERLVRFTPDWSPMGFSAEIRSDAPVGTTNIDQDLSRTGNQWRFTTDISRTGETVDTFMGFVKWIDQATIDAYAAANLPLTDLQGKPITKVGWVDFTRSDASTDGVQIGSKNNGEILFLDYIITDNAFGDKDLRLGYITDPGMPVFLLRDISVVGKTDVSEGSKAVFEVNLNAPKSGLTEITLSLQDAAGGTDSLEGRPLDYAPDMQAYYFDAQGARYTLPVVGGKVQLPSGVTSFLVSVNTVQDTEYEGRESFTLTASLPEGTADTGSATIVDDGTGQVYDDKGLNPTGPGNDDRGIAVSGLPDVSEGSNAIFTVTLPNGNARATEISLALSHGTGATDAESDDYSATFTAYYYAGTTKTALTITAGKITLPAGVTSFFVSAPTTQDTVFEGSEAFSLTAAIAGGKSATGSSTIVDDGTGQVYDDKGLNPTGPGNDDRSIAVSGLPDVSEGSHAIFTVTMPVNARDTEISLGLNSGVAESSDYSSTFTAYYYVGTTKTALTITDGKIILPAGVTTFYVSVPTTQDAIFEGAEDFSLTASITGGKSASGSSTIVDDGSGKVYNDKGANPAGPGDDDRPKAVILPPLVLPPAPVAPPAALPVREQPAPPPLSFNSQIQPLASRATPAEVLPPVGDVLTSVSGFRVAVNERAAPGLSLNRGITDQFAEGNGSSTKLSLPFDAFIHSNKEAVIKLEAKLADNSPLPSWVRFDPATGSFEVNPPKSFKGKLDLKVVAMDNDGREATAIFQMFVGDKPAEQRPQSRDSFSDKLRMTAQRQIKLVKVGDAGAHGQVRDVPARAAPARAVAG